MTYWPRFSSSYLASTCSMVPSVSLLTKFSATTTSLGCVTAKYGSAVTMRPNVWRSVVATDLHREPKLLLARAIRERRGDVIEGSQAHLVVGEQERVVLGVGIGARY